MANLMLACEVPYYLAAFNIFLDKAIATRDISNVVIPTSIATRLYPPILNHFFVIAGPFLLHLSQFFQI